MTIAEQKKELRKEIRGKEKILTDIYKKTSSSAICRILLEQPAFENAHTVLSFVGRENEIDTTELLKSVWSQKKVLCVPRCREEHQMDICIISSFDDLERAAYGILEPKANCPVAQPAQLDVAVIPCLSFDRQGNRLGQGGGYYDRFLPQLHCPTYLVCREQLLSVSVPVEPHDQKCSFFVTENGVIDCR